MQRPKLLQLPLRETTRRVDSTRLFFLTIGAATFFLVIFLGFWQASYDSHSITLATAMRLLPTQPFRHRHLAPHGKMEESFLFCGDFDIVHFNY